MVLGRFKATGIRPRFSERLKSFGIDLSSTLFSNMEAPALAPARQPVVGIPTTAWAAAGMVFLAVALGAVALALMVEWSQERNRQRNVLQKLRRFETSMTETGGGIFRGPGPSAPQWLQDMAARTPAFGDLQLLLEQSGSRWTMQAFLLLSFGFAAALGLAVSAALGRVADRGHRRRDRRAGAVPHPAPPPAPAPRRVRGRPARRDRSARPRHPGRPSALLRAADGGGRDPGAGRRRVPARLRGAAVRSPLRRRRQRHGRPGGPGGRAHPGDGDPDPAPGRRQPGRGAGQPRGRDPEAVRHPPPAPHLHRAGPHQRLRAGAAADRRRHRDLSS